MIRTGEYFLVWNHGGQRTLGEDHFANKLYDRETTCKIWRGDTIIAEGAAKKSKKDPVFCKETARKLSLTRAISGLDKTERAKIWKGYFAR